MRVGRQFMDIMLCNIMKIGRQVHEHKSMNHIHTTLSINIPAFYTKVYNYATPEVVEQIQVTSCIFFLQRFFPQTIIQMPKGQIQCLHQHKLLTDVIVHITVCYSQEHLEANRVHLQRFLRGKDTYFSHSREEEVVLDNHITRSLFTPSINKILQACYCPSVDQYCIPTTC